MNIYHVTQSEVKGYDTYGSFVCIAPSAKFACDMNPSGRLLLSDHAPTGYPYLYWPETVKHIRAELLGESFETLTRIVCASFNAG